MNILLKTEQTKGFKSVNIKKMINRVAIYLYLLIFIDGSSFHGKKYIHISLESITQY